MSKVAIIGGGAAGMLAGIMLADKGYNVSIFEKNEKLGKKLFITGKGRCNITNACDTEDFFKNVVSNSKFMYSSVYGFGPDMVMDFFEGLGLRLKVERGNRVFPLSDHSSDVIAVLTAALKEKNVDVRLMSEVTEIICEEAAEEEFTKKIIGIRVKRNKTIEELFFDRVVVATGGLSYPRTGSTGDGIRWAGELGLNVVTPTPALVPLNIKEKYCKDIMGLALKNVEVSFYTRLKNKDKCIYSGFGEMLFTHFGVSGPIILSASSYIGKYISNGVWLSIDLKPALDKKQLDERILKDFGENTNKQFRNSLNELLPKNLIPIIIEETKIDPYKKVNEITREERLLLVDTLKGLRLNVESLRAFDEAIITQGGVSVKEINPSDMSCKHIKNLAFIGEVLDVDALTGGFNLQIAWSTAAALQ